MEHLKALAIGVAIIGPLAGVIFVLSRIEWGVEIFLGSLLLASGYCLGRSILIYRETRR